MAAMPPTITYSTFVSGERVDQRERLELIGQRVSRPVPCVPARER
jgi:hypothetical protein